MTGRKRPFDGDRWDPLPAALHRIAVVQARVDPRAQACLARKRAEGKTGKTARETRRSLKRHLANVVYRRLYAWAEIALPASIT